MAFVAHDDMKKAFKATAFASYMISKPKQPAVTTTLVIDNTAYISSSMCGGPYLYRPNGNTGANQARFTDLNPDHPCAGPVQDALTRCQLTNIVGHRTGASCGEPMAALAFCATHNEGDFSNAKIVSIIGRAETSSKIVAPCGNPDGQLVSSISAVSEQALQPGLLWSLLTSKSDICGRMGLPRFYDRERPQYARHTGEYGQNSDGCIVG
jgi:hypothetical protein